MDDHATPHEFSRIRRLLWPVHRFELKKIVPMLFIFFFLTFDYNILRVMKDTLVVTAKHSGAEVIPFIKVWVMFPTSVALTYLFIRLSNRFSKERVFYLMLSLFLGYFFVFTFLIYPARDTFHPHASADHLQSILPAGLKGFVAMYRYWTFTIFYVMSELWSNIIVALVFWGFANQSTTIDQAKRFYGLFGIGINFSGIAAGLISIFATELFVPHVGLTAEEAWGKTMTLLISLVLIAGVATMIAFRYLHKAVVKDPRLDGITANAAPQDTTEKKKFSMRENFRTLSTSKYILCLALIVIAYNCVINLTEVLWKQEVREFCPDPRDYNTYMNKITTLIGMFATVVSLVISGNLIRKFGWTFTAMITPVILFITSIGFFGFFFLKGNTQLILDIFGATPLAIAVFFGSAQNCLSRAAKYTVFDSTKEMAYVPLSHDLKLKAKAAIDGVFYRFGKSSGSVIYQALLIALSTITACVPYVAICLFAIISAMDFCRTTFR